MSTNLESVEKAAMELSEQGRARPADSLLETLPDLDQQGIEEAWVSEVERRSQEFDEEEVAPDFSAEGGFGRPLRKAVAPHG